MAGAIDAARRRQLEDVRRSTRDSARGLERSSLDALDVARAGPGAMAPPERLKKEAMRWGGAYRSTQAADWDWFYGLSRAEQARLRENWFARPGHGEAPDEIAERIPIKEWLALTRTTDMARAMATGRNVNRDRYGNMSPASLVAGEPYDFAILHGKDDRAAWRHIERARREGRLGRHHAENAGSRVRFFTDEKGIVHPIRASEHRAPTGVYNRATGTYEPARHVAYGSDEPF